MKSIWPMLAALALGGCAFVNTVDPASARKVDITSPNSSEVTYRNILTSLRHCYPVRARLEADYYPEAKDGTITYIGSEEPSRVEFFKVRVSATATGSSAQFLGNPNFAAAFEPAYQDWVAGKTETCPLSTRPRS